MTDEVTTQTAVPRKNWRRIGMLIITVGLAIIVCVVGYGYYQLAQVNVSLTRQTTTNQQQLDALQKSMADLQQTNRQSQEFAAKQQQMISEWEAAQKGDLEKWYVAEAEYLVKLANDHVQFTHNVTLAITLLQRADQIIGNLQDSSLLDIRKSIATNLANLQSTQPIDITKIYVQLAALNNLMDQLPLPASPLATDDKSAPVVNEPGLPWWQAGLHRSWQVLSKIIIVRNTTQNSLPLVLPEEKLFLYQNLHAQMESAMWGVLHNDAVVYQMSMTRSIDWVKKYFMQDSPAVKSMLQQLQSLQALNLQPPMTNLAATMQLFDNYFSQNKTIAP
jgi:uroporphyrin-III C-methyltransferase